MKNQNANLENKTAVSESRPNLLLLTYKHLLLVSINEHFLVRQFSSKFVLFTNLFLEVFVSDFYTVSVFPIFFIGIFYLFCFVVPFIRSFKV